MIVVACAAVDMALIRADPFLFLGLYASLIVTLTVVMALMPAGRPASLRMVLRALALAWLVANAAIVLFLFAAFSLFLILVHLGLPAYLPEGLRAPLLFAATVGPAGLSTLAFTWLTIRSLWTPHPGPTIRTRASVAEP